MTFPRAHLSLMRPIRRVAGCAMVAAAVGAAAGCAGGRAGSRAGSRAAAGAPAPAVRPVRMASSQADSGMRVEPAASGAAGCAACTKLPMPPELAAAIEVRVAELKARGGDCAAYGIVLEDALEGGHITIKPYMWRVRGNLASAEGESSGEMTIARDIDSLNVGVRALDDVLHSAEHEAAHIALRIASGDEVREARVEERVTECRAPVRLR